MQHKNKKSKGTRDCLQHTLVRPSWSMLPLFVTHTLRRIYSSWEKYSAGHHAGPPAVLTTGQASLPLKMTLVGELLNKGGQMRVCAFSSKVYMYGLVALPLPEYIRPSNRISRYCHEMTFPQLHTSTSYYKYSFFPLAIVQWNALPETVACLPNIDSFKVAVSKLQHTRP